MQEWLKNIIMDESSGFSVIASIKKA